VPFAVAGSGEMFNFHERLAERLVFLGIHDSHHHKDVRCGILAGLVHVTIEFLHRADDIGWRGNVLTLYADPSTFGVGSC